MAIQHEKYAKLKLTEWKGMSVLHVSILYIQSFVSTSSRWKYQAF